MTHGFILFLINTVRRTVSFLVSLFWLWGVAEFMSLLHHYLLYCSVTVPDDVEALCGGGEQVAFSVVAGHLLYGVAVSNGVNARRVHLLNVELLPHLGVAVLLGSALGNVELAL